MREFDGFDEKLLKITPTSQVQYITKLIAGGLHEITKPFKYIALDNNGLNDIRNEINLLMKALQMKNKIYDYVVDLNYDSIKGGFYGRIVFDLIDIKHNDLGEDFTGELDFIIK